MEEKLCQCCHEKDGSEMKGEIRLKYLCDELHSNAFRTEELVTSIDFDTNELVVSHIVEPTNIPNHWFESEEIFKRKMDEFNKRYPSKEWRMAIEYCPFCGRKL